MYKENLLKEYKENVENLKKCLKRNGVRDAQILMVFQQSFDKLKSSTNAKGQSPQGNRFKKSVFVASLCILPVFLYVLLYVHTPTSSIVLRNVQGLTYPALKIVRTLSEPLRKLVPSLTDLYDESCLVANPYFHLSNMDCSPCESVHSVMDLTGIDAFEELGEGTPFIVKTNQHEISFNDLQQLYNNYPAELSSEARRAKISNSDIRNLTEAFSANEANLSSNLHIHMRFNKMGSARVIRQLFPKPYFLPERAGQAVERFVHIDGPTADAYNLPSPECSSVFVIQGAGERTVVLRPSKECKSHCKTVSILMTPSYVLLYNWWYWRPVSLPGKTSSNLSISYLNSYC